MSNNLTNPNEKKDNKNLNIILIVGFTAAFIICALFIKSLGNKDKNNNNSSVSNINNNNTVAAVSKNVPDATKGSIDAKIDSAIVFRDIDFKMSVDDVKKMEDANDDTLPNPTVSKSGDGYTYIYYESNPDKPLNFSNVSVGSQNAPGLTYVFNSDSLEEVRLQFGLIDEGTFNSLLGAIKHLYGDSTFYRAQDGTESYWWNSDKQLFMLTQDSYSTTLFFRRK
ncbi:MAG: hypothetical protein E7254_01730 [Lachnospiraceae bacterium]|nr:hypothetical protein [Lachnospiraceae bacterium]